MGPTREEQSRKRKKKRVKKMKAAIAKLIPVLVAVALIIAIGGIYYGRTLIENVYYSSERKDLNEYYELFDANDVAVFIQNSYVPEKAKYINGACYFDLDMIGTYFGNRFYVNSEEAVVMYTTQTDIYEAGIGEENKSYSVNGEVKTLETAPAVLYKEEVLISVEFLKMFESFAYEFYPTPNRLLLYTQSVTYPAAVITKETKIRVLGGVKSEIVADLAAEDRVFILEEMEKWSKVVSTDGYMGYIENKRFEKDGDVAKTPVPEQVADGYTPILMEGVINMGFHQVFSQKANETFESSVKDAVGMNVIAPTWFRVQDDEGTLEAIANKEYVQKAHEKGMQVWAVYTDVDYSVNLEGILGVTAKRRALIDRMVAYALEYGIDGINIDFETVKPETGADFAQFLRELSIQTHANNLVLSVCNYAPTASTEHYNRAEQGIVADYVVVMGYDEHWATSDVAGSVASIDFVEGGILRTIESGVAANRIINAIPFYTRLWKTENGQVSSEVKGMSAAKKWAEENGVELIWDNMTCQYYAEMQADGVLYQIWLEEEESIQTKLNVMKTNGVAGVAEWKLGFEQAEIWEIISAYQNS